MDKDKVLINMKNRRRKKEAEEKMRKKKGVMKGKWKGKDGRVNFG